MQTVHESPNESSSIVKDSIDDDRLMASQKIASDRGSRPVIGAGQAGRSPAKMEQKIDDLVPIEHEEVYGIIEAYPRKIVFAGSFADRNVRPDLIQRSNHSGNTSPPREISRRVITNESHRIVTHQEVVRRENSPDANHYRGSPYTAEHEKLMTSSMAMNQRQDPRLSPNSHSPVVVRDERQQSELVSPQRNPTLVSSSVYFPSPGQRSPKSSPKKKFPASVSSVVVEKRPIEINQYYDERDIGKSLVHGQEIQQGPEVTKFTHIETTYTEKEKLNQPVVTESVIVTSSPEKPSPTRQPINSSLPPPDPAKVPPVSKPTKSEPKKPAPSIVDKRESILECDRWAGFQEMRETLILEPYSYFSKFNVFTFPTEEDFYKIETDRNCNFLYLTGRSGVLKLEMVKRSLKTTASKLEQSCVASKHLPNGRILTQSTEDNSLLLLDSNLNVLSKSEGNLKAAVPSTLF